MQKRTRIKRSVPNMFTLGNAACGFTAIVCAATQGQPGWLVASAILIFAAMAFDACDGRVARMMNVTSELGADLDSLSDAVSFGVAPAVVLYALLQNTLPFAVLWLAGALYVGCAVTRLARFNVETVDASEDSHLWFSGLPSTGGAATVCGGVALFRHADAVAQLLGTTCEATAFTLACLIVAATAAASFLMVSRIRFPHLNLLIRLIKRNKST